MNVRPACCRELCTLSAILLLSCGSETTTTVERLQKPPMTLTSPAFTHGGIIPDRCSWSADNLSPPLKWKNTPEGVRSFALIMRDQDAERKHYVHWVVMNLPADTRYLSEGAGSRSLVPGESMSMGSYLGVVPQKDYRFHRYVFTLYALDAMLTPDTVPFDIERLEQLVAGHVLAKAELMGRYGRSRLVLPRFVR